MMHGFDWVIVAGFLVALALSAWSMRSHANSVSGFLSAGNGPQNLHRIPLRPQYTLGPCSLLGSASSL